MEKQTKVLILTGLVITIVIGFSLSQGDTPTVATTGGSDATSEVELNVNEEVEVREVDGEMMDGPETTATANTVGSYLAYSPDAIASSEAENILLTFSATWCPSCRTLDKDITSNLGDIPAGTEIYKVDYDTNVALRQKYGVTMQHTHVLVDSNGTLIKKWSGGNTLSDLVSSI